MKNLFEINRKLVLTLSLAALLWMAGLWIYLLQQALAWEYYVAINRMQKELVAWWLSSGLLLGCLLLFLPRLKRTTFLWGTLFTLAFLLMTQMFYWRIGNLEAVVPGLHTDLIFIDLVMKTYLWPPLLGAVLVVPTGMNLYILLKQRTVG
ncbi:MAG: hypothetical protein AAF804_02545 [Bacteroidota bacterium]